MLLSTTELRRDLLASLADPIGGGLFTEGGDPAGVLAKTVASCKKDSSELEENEDRLRLRSSNGCEMGMLRTLDSWDTNELLATDTGERVQPDETPSLLDSMSSEPIVLHDSCDEHTEPSIR
jgi:hypothetical protein